MVVPKGTGGKGRQGQKCGIQVETRSGSGREANLALLLLNHLKPSHDGATPESQREGRECGMPIIPERQREGRECGMNLVLLL